MCACVCVCVCVCVCIHMCMCTVCADAWTVSVCLCAFLWVSIGMFTVLNESQGGSCGQMDANTYDLKVDQSK